MSGPDKTTPSQSDTLRCFTGRAEVVAAFDRLFGPSCDHRILLVDGLSGTGKSYLADWLRLIHRPDLPSARIQLSPVFQEGEILSSVARQLGSSAGETYASEVATVEKARRDNPVVQLSFSQSAKARLGGSISGADQSVQVSIAGVADILNLQQNAQRLDAFTKAIAPITSSPCVVFFDECEYLAVPALRNFILEVLVRRLSASGAGVRLYFTGQSVPSEFFSITEYHHVHLGEFSQRETAEFLKQAGFADAGVSEEVYEFTRGHPLLVAMYAGYLSETRQGEGSRRAGHPYSADEATRTRWIYDRVISRFTDEKLRSFAANLSLLEWFDLSLIRAIFGRDISEDAFHQMVQRAFVKRYGARWRCHDIIRKYLPEHREAIDPDECLTVHRRAAEALLERLNNEEERVGGYAFPDRLLVVTAILHSLSKLSRKRTEQFVWNQVALALGHLETDYVLGLARDLQFRAEPASVSELGHETKRLLEHISQSVPDEGCCAFLERLAEAAVAGADVNTATSLYALASAWTGGTKSVELAAQICRLDDSLTFRVFHARIAARAGDRRTAEHLLAATRSQFGDCAELRLFEADLAMVDADKPKAVAILTDCLADFPNSALEALSRFYHIAVGNGDLSAAANHLDAILERDPENFEAINLRTTLFLEQGRVRDAMAMAQRAIRNLTRVGSCIFEAFRRLESRGLREEILAAFLSDAASVNVGIVLFLIQKFAVGGEIDKVEALAERISNTWPECADVCALSRAVARIRVGRASEGITLLEPMARRRLVTADIYILLALCYRETGRLEDERSLLEQAMQMLPHARDIFGAKRAESLAQTSPQTALQYLDSLEREQPLGALCALVKTNLIETAEPEKALEILERLVYTETRDTLPTPLMLSARHQLIAILVRAGRKSEAIEMIESTLAHFPNDSESVIQIALALADLGDEDRLRRLFESFRDRDPTAAWTILNVLGHHIGGKGKDISSLVEEFKQHPERLELVLAIEEVLFQRSSLDKIDEIFSYLHSVSPGCIEQLQTLRRRMVAGMSDLDMTEIVEDLLSSRNPSAKEVVGLAELLASRGRVDEALVLTDRLEKSSVTVSLKLRILINAGRFDQAEEVFRAHAGSEGSHWTSALVTLADVLMQRRGSFDERLQYLIEIAEHSDGLVRQTAVGSAVRALKQIGRSPEALELLDRMASRDESGAGALILRTEILVDLQQYSEAIEVAERVENSSGASEVYRATASKLRGDAMFRNGDPSGSLLAHSTSLDHLPLAETYLAIAAVHEALGDPVKAYAAARNAVLLDPSIVTGVGDLLQRLRSAQVQAKQQASVAATSGFERHASDEAT